MAKLTEDEVSSLTLEAVGALLHKMPDNDSRQYAMEMLMMIGYQFMRQFGGDEYTLGWLESAVKEVKNNAPSVVYRAPH